MTQSKNALRWGANFTALSAGLHILAFVVGGFRADALQLLPIGIVYAGFAYGLFQGWRLMAYIVFIVILIGTIMAVSRIWALGDVPGWLYAGIALANLLSAASLFAAIWKTPQALHD
ncbi:MAG: hypothetical protein KC448_01270 [Yoonia sp.]|nr:hypothetical protein [Yoonia sp.]